MNNVAGIDVSKGKSVVRYTGMSSTERAAERLDELDRRWYL